MQQETAIFYQFRKEINKEYRKREEFHGKDAPRQARVGRAFTKAGQIRATDPSHRNIFIGCFAISVCSEVIFLFVSFREFRGFLSASLNPVLVCDHNRYFFCP